MTAQHGAFCGRDRLGRLNRQYAQVTWCEMVFGTHSIYARIAQPLLAPAACIWRNWATGADDKRSLIADDRWTQKESLI
jgi:hypothetical protein